MAFFSGFMLGGLVGLAFVITFVYLENRRSLQRQRMAIFIASLSRLTLADTRHLFGKEKVPSWIFFPTLEKVDFLNQELRRAWPYIDKAASLLLKSIVEPVLEQYKPSSFQSLNFQKFTLGTFSPQIIGVDLPSCENGEIMMSIEVQWNGNASMILAVQPVVGLPFSVEVKDAAFSGTFHLIFKPLVNEIPGFGALVFSVHSFKKLDFKVKHVSGEVPLFPGLDGMVEGIIKTAVQDSLMWPARNIVPVVPGDYRDLELHVVGILEVKLVQAKQLKNKDFIGKSDPFAQAYVRPIPSRMKKTKTINNDIDPIWNEHFKLEVEDLSSQKLTIKVFDDEGLHAAQLIGVAELELKTLKPEELEDIWLPVVKESKKEEYRGEVHVELIYHSLEDEASTGTASLISSSQASMASPTMPLTSLEKVITSNMNGLRHSPYRSLMREGAIIRGILSVAILRAENLISDLNHKCDAYVVVRMKKSDIWKTTKVISGSLAPEWNQNFDFMVEDALHDMVLVEVFDHDTFREKSLGKCALTLTRVLREGEHNTEVQLLGGKNGSLFLCLKWIQPQAPDLQYL